MSFDLFVYTSSPVEESSEFVQLREWSPAGGGWVCKARGWQIVVNPSEELAGVDELPAFAEVRRIRPDVRWRTEINIEGRQSGEAFMIALASAQKFAFRRHGVTYDPQQDVIAVPLSEGAVAAAPAGS